MEAEDAAADAVRTKDTTIRHFGTFTQLASIEAGSLRAPDGQHDDLADAFALACLGREKLPASGPIDTSGLQMRNSRALFGGNGDRWEPERSMVIERDSQRRLFR